ncbi:aspartyl/asparaginyl beta-hydroxylase domain-containing protein [bacterium]|nr:aspartyl/asparaginyl beta-hydroxylase domain-containing protein [bacterium]
MKKQDLPTITNFNLKIDLQKLQKATDELAAKFVDVKTANPMLCDNHMELVSQVYDNFEQINLTTPREILPYTSSIKERLRRKEEHLYNVPTKDYAESYFEEIVTQLKAPASRIRITKLAPGKAIPFHVDYDVSYAVRCICPVYGDKNVVNVFKRNGKLEAYNLENGNAYFLNIGYPHAVMNMSDKPRIALMFSLDGTADLENA